MILERIEPEERLVEGISPGDVFAFKVANIGPDLR